jgi:hypothetical protein
LVDAWIEDAGGLDAWRSVKSVRYTVTTAWFDTTGTEVRRRPRFVWGKKNPQRARIERNEAEGYYVQAHDGRGNVWATLNGEMLSADTKAVQEVLYVGGDVRYIPADSTGHAGVAVTFGEGVGDHSDRYYYYFSQDSPKAIEVHYIEEGRTNVNRTRWTDYKKSGPITFVGTRTYYDERGVTRKQLIISDVLINPDVPDSLFAAPGR